MAGPWEKYQQPAEQAPAQPQGPWSRYQAPAEPSAADRVVGAAEAGLHGGAMGAQGFTRGFADMLGLPVDAINNLPRLANILPGDQGFTTFTDNPVGGGESIYQTLMAPRTVTQMALGEDVGDLEARNVVEQIIERTGEEIGATAVPVAGMLASGLRAGVQGSRAMQQGGGAISRAWGRAIEPYAINAGAAAGKEAAYATGAGIGAGAAGSMVSDGDPNTMTLAEYLADLSGAVAGAGAVGAGRGAASAVKDGASAMFGVGGNDIVKDAVAGQLGRAANAPMTPAGTADTSGLAEALAQGRRVSTSIPGFRESTGDVLQNPGLGSLEYSRQSGDNAGLFNTRRQDNNRAIEEAIVAQQPDATPGAYTSTAEGIRNADLREARDMRFQAEDDYERAYDRLQTAMSGEERGQVLRGALDDALAAARDQEREAWTGIGGNADIRPLAEAFDALSSGLTSAQRETIRNAERLTGIPASLVPDDEVAAAAGAPVDLAEITTLRSSLTDMVREARSAGRREEAYLLDQYVSTIDDYMENALPPEMSDTIQNARAVSRDLNDRFTRPGTPIAQALDRNQGQPRLPDSQVAGKFVAPDEGQASNIDALLREANDAEDVRGALQDQILADVEKQKLLAKPDRLNEYLGRYEAVFEKFPELRQELGTAAGLRRRADDLAEGETRLTRELGDPDGSIKGTSTVARYLSYGDERARDAMASVVNTRDPAAAADELMEFVGDDPEAVRGAQAAFWDLMESKAKATGVTTRGAGGESTWRPSSLYNFLQTPKNKAVMERLYRDDPEQMQRIQQIAEDLRSVDLRVTSRAPASSGTAQAVRGNEILPSTETLGAYSFAYQRGQVGLPFIGLRLGSTMARRAILKGRTEQFGEMLDKALLDPDFAEMLLRENNPADIEAMRRSVKAWAGVRAPQFLDLLESDEEEDPVMDAVQR